MSFLSGTTVVRVKMIGLVKKHTIIKFLQQVVNVWYKHESLSRPAFSRTCNSCKGPTTLKRPAVQSHNQTILQKTDQILMKLKTVRRIIPFELDILILSRMVQYNWKNSDISLRSTTAE